MKNKLQHKLAGLLLAVLLLGATSSARAHTQNFHGFTSFAAGASANINGALTTHFTASYFNGFGGFFTAAGERIVKTGPKAFTKDSETFLISDISTFPAGTYTLTPTFVPVLGIYVGFFSIPIYPGVEFLWFSDFDGQVAVSGTIVVTDNGDGTGTMNAAFYY
jgi:hypothetical protein